MAADWIPWEDGLQDKPEVLAMARHLGIDNFSVAGRCAEVWAWAGRFTANGKIKHVGAQDIDNVARLPEFNVALAKVGWLRIEDDGVFFPNWNKHNSKSAKARALSQKRMQRLRDGRVTLGAQQKPHHTTRHDTIGEKNNTGNGAAAQPASGPGRAATKTRRQPLCQRGAMLLLPLARALKIDGDDVWPTQRKAITAQIRLICERIPVEHDPVVLRAAAEAGAGAGVDNPAAVWWAKLKSQYPKLNGAA